jgi:hypothetical protein
MIATWRGIRQVLVELFSSRNAKFTGNKFHKRNGQPPLIDQDIHVWRFPF